MHPAAQCAQQRGARAKHNHPTSSQLHLVNSLTPTTADNSTAAHLVCHIHGPRVNAAGDPPLGCAHCLATLSPAICISSHLVCRIDRTRANAAGDPADAVGAAHAHRGGGHAHAAAHHLRMGGGRREEGGGWRSEMVNGVQESLFAKARATTPQPPILV